MSLSFLVEHDRHGKIPTRITVYDDWKAAEERLFRLELDQLDVLNACLKAGKPVRMEYVVLGGASLETIKQTHGRYFGGEYEVLRPVGINHGVPGAREFALDLTGVFSPAPVGADAAAPGVREFALADTDSILLTPDATAVPVA